MNKNLKQDETFLTKLGLQVNKTTIKEKPDQTKSKNNFSSVESFDETREKPEFEAKLSLPDLKPEREIKQVKEKVKAIKEKVVKYEDRLDKRSIVRIKFIYKNNLSREKLFTKEFFFYPLILITTLNFLFNLE